MKGNLNEKYESIFNGCGGCVHVCRHVGEIPTWCPDTYEYHADRRGDDGSDAPAMNCYMRMLNKRIFRNQLSAWRAMIDLFSGAGGFSRPI